MLNAVNLGNLAVYTLPFPFSPSPSPPFSSPHPSSSPPHSPSPLQTKAISWCGYTVHILLGPGSWPSHVTDVYHIGLTQMAKMPHSDVTVELSKSCCDEAKFIHMNNLIRFLQTDPDLAEILILRCDVTTHLFLVALAKWVSSQHFPVCFFHSWKGRCWEHRICTCVSWHQIWCLPVIPQISWLWFLEPHFGISVTDAWSTVLHHSCNKWCIRQSLQVAG